MIENILRNELLSKGAVFVGFGDLHEVPAKERYNMPIGICVAVKYDKETIETISEHPTLEYLKQYKQLNEALDSMVTIGAEIIKANGYQAIAKICSEVEKHETNYSSMLPHKTIATRAGLGWIGKCALLVTEKYGSMIRISSILTDAPLPVAKPINESRCGDCSECQNFCPAKAVQGNLWSTSSNRDNLLNAVKCRKKARELSAIYLNQEISLFGKCIVSCPFTKRYLHTVLANRET